MAFENLILGIVSALHLKKEEADLIKGLKIVTTRPSQIPSFPGLTGESRKSLDARLRSAGMTRKKENLKMRQFNNETFNIFHHVVVAAEMVP